LLAGAATGIGLVAVAAPGGVRRRIGVPPEPAAEWALRTFGVRELGLAALLWRATASSDAASAMALRRVVTAIQVADAALAGWQALGGRGAGSSGRRWRWARWRRSRSAAGRAGDVVVRRPRR